MTQNRQGERDSFVFHAVPVEAWRGKTGWSYFTVAITSKVISLHHLRVHWLMLDVAGNLILAHAQWHWKWSEPFVLTHGIYTALSDRLWDPTRVLRHTPYAWPQASDLIRTCWKRVLFPHIYLLTSCLENVCSTEHDGHVALRTQRVNGNAVGKCRLIQLVSVLPK